MSSLITEIHHIENRLYELAKIKHHNFVESIEWHHLNNHLSFLWNKRLHVRRLEDTKYLSNDIEKKYVRH